jgi:hypothetical protein
MPGIVSGARDETVNKGDILFWTTGDRCQYLPDMGDTGEQLSLQSGESHEVSFGHVAIEILVSSR